MVSFYWLKEGKTEEKGEQEERRKEKKNMLLLLSSDSPISIPPLFHFSMKCYEKNLQHTGNQLIDIFVMVL